MKTWEEFRTTEYTSFDGGFVTWYVIAMPTWEHVRQYRDWRLHDCDVDVLRYGEIGVAVPAELLAYRQALRDITDTYSDPADVVFPDRPDIPFPGDAVSQGERLEAAELLLSLLLEDPLRGAI